MLRFGMNLENVSYFLNRYISHLIMANKIPLAIMIPQVMPNNATVDSTSKRTQELNDIAIRLNIPNFFILKRFELLLP